MKILIRNNNKDRWQAVESAPFEAETEFQGIIAKEPSLVTINEVREGLGNLVAVIREFPLDIGNIDVLGFTQDGHIAIIECKLAKNSEIKRKVIGQLFEYGAALWGIDYETLDQRVFQRTGKNLVEYIKTAYEEPSWDEGLFRSNISESLRAGSFVLMIVVDEIDEDLVRIVQYINNSGDPAFSLAAFEMKRFRHGDIEVLVPHVFGILEKENPQKTTLQSEYIEFYGKCIESLKKLIPGNYKSPSPISFYQIKTGIGSVHFEWGFHGQPRSSFGVELHMEKSSKELNLAIFELCAEKKDQLENAIKEKIILQRDWGKAWSRIYAEKQEGKFTEELGAWAVEKMEIMINILGPELKKFE